MINVGNKGTVPNSLAYPITIEKKPSRATQPSRTTHTERQASIDAGKYIDSDRYKQDDTKAALHEHYHHKCCYCEQPIEAGHVEHYRPKSNYWWLAYSWDNLLWVCPTCNTNKSNHFEISNTNDKAVYNSLDLPHIHALRDVYNALEVPSLLNPECDDLDDMWAFRRKGEMSSEKYRGKYTIEILHLDRIDLRDDRKKIVDEFEEDALDLFVRYESNRKILEDELYFLVEKFAKKSNNDKENFLAFRRYACTTFVNDIVLDIYVK